MKHDGNTGFSTYERTDEIEVGDVLASNEGDGVVPGFQAFDCSVVAKVDVERGIVTLARPMAYVRDTFESIHLTYERFCIESSRVIRYYRVFCRGASGKKMQFLV